MSVQKDKLAASTEAGEPLLHKSAVAGSTDNSRIKRQSQLVKRNKSKFKSVSLYQLNYLKIRNLLCSLSIAIPTFLTS